MKNGRFLNYPKQKPAQQDNYKEEHMTDTLKSKCELFEQNRSVISKKFMFEKDLMSISAGLIFTGAGKEADIDKLNECRVILNKHTGLFSEYRDSIKMALLSEMALTDDPAQYIEDVKTVFHIYPQESYRETEVKSWVELMTLSAAQIEIFLNYQDIADSKDREDDYEVTDTYRAEVTFTEIYPWEYTVSVQILWNGDAAKAAFQIKDGKVSYISDFESLETLIQDIHESGRRKGLKEAGVVDDHTGEPEINLDLRELEKQIKAVKGVGEKRAEEIMGIVEKWLGLD
jgi:hypothetical protein